MHCIFIIFFSGPADEVPKTPATKGCLYTCVQWWSSDDGDGGEWFPPLICVLTPSNAPVRPPCRFFFSKKSRIKLDPSPKETFHRNFFGEVHPTCPPQKTGNAPKMGDSLTFFLIFTHFSGFEIGIVWDEFLLIAGNCAFLNHFFLDPSAGIFQQTSNIYPMWDFQQRIQKSRRRFFFHFFGRVTPHAQDAPSPEGFQGWTFFPQCHYP